MRHEYLRTWNRGIFDGMLLKGTLNAHLEEIDRLANEMMDYLVSQMVKQEGVTEQLKADDQMECVQRMNCIRSRAEEIVSSELIIRDSELFLFLLQNIPVSAFFVD